MSALPTMETPPASCVCRSGFYTTPS